MFTRCNTRKVLLATTSFLVGLQFTVAQDKTVSEVGGLDPLKAAPTPAVTVSPQIAPGVFHLVMNALPDSAVPPASPFVVAPANLYSLLPENVLL